MAYRMPCDTPQLRYTADERTAMVAEKIIELAKAGETDPERLCTAALRSLTHGGAPSHPDGCERACSAENTRRLARRSYAGDWVTRSIRRRGEPAFR